MRAKGGRRVLPDPAGDMAGLATQLGRALAQLDAFEALCSDWNPDLGCFAWQLTDPLPVKRLRQKPPKLIRSRQHQRHQVNYREKLLKLIDGKFDAGYQKGLRDAANGVRENPASD